MYVVEVPVRETGRFLRYDLKTSYQLGQTINSISAIKSIPGNHATNLHHLRRVIKDEYLPASLLAAKGAAVATSISRTAALDDLTSSERSGPHVLDGPSILEASLHDLSLVTRPDQVTVHIFLCPTFIISEDSLQQHLQNRIHGVPRASIDEYDPTKHREPLEPSSIEVPAPLGHVTPTRPWAIFRLSVPSHPPISYEHATSQSCTLWPTIFNPNSLYGPNPAILASAQAEINRTVGQYMSLALTAGKDARLRCEGEAVGVVVVERINGQETIVCVTSDQRWIRSGDRGQRPTGPDRPRDNGNPAAHAVMRAIEFVASTRQRLANPIEDSTDDPPARNNLQPNGYLCLNLEFYVSHEPCVMCSMALVHSRVGRVVFQHYMEATGGLVADRRDATQSTLDHGLFWREDLNWRFLCWRWETTTGESLEHEIELARDIHA